MKTDPCAELVARCFAARTGAHFFHLKTRSYSAHMALGEFYDAIAEAADEYAECHMGVEGQIEDYPDVPVPRDTPLAMLTELHSWIKDHRTECADGSTELANLIDNILAVIDRSYYKLKFLK